MTSQTTAIQIAGYTFEGPYRSSASLADRAGVYAIVGLRAGQYHLIDVGESGNVRSRVETHDRKPCWSRSAGQGELRVAVHYTPGLTQVGRMRIEQRIRQQYRPPCGLR